MMSEIKFLFNDQIDPKAWDRCLHKAKEGRIYGTRLYLDAVSPGWAALVKGDYDRVMPLAVHKKWAISYVAQPWFCQQLGVFSPNMVETQEVQLFLNAIPKRYWLVDINLNHTNARPVANWVATKRDNFELDLSQPYETIYKAFNQNTRRNLRKAQKEPLTISHNISIENFILLKKENEKVPISKLHYTRLENLLNALISGEKAEIWGMSNEDGKLLASVCLVDHGRYLTYLLASSNEEGVQRRAMFALVNSIIHSYATTAKVLDFEGSMIPGVARFYQGFGAEVVHFYRVRQGQRWWK